MRDKLPKTPHHIECGIINLDSNKGNGTHWVAFHKNNNNTEYFDSFGNLQPPLEVLRYLGNYVKYNYKRYQKLNSFNCGHLCLEFLLNIKKVK